jgi:hypothetical protein
MIMNSNQIHKGLDHEMEFKGLTPPFLYYMIGLLLGAILLFLMLKGIGVPVLLAVGITMGLLTWLGAMIYRLNRELGRTGMIRKSSYAQVPFRIRIKDRSPILLLRKNQPKN